LRLALAALVAAFVVAANVLTTRGRLAGGTYGLTFYGLAMAVFAFVRYFAGDAPSETVSPAVQGMFVNRNHFAGHMELLLPFPVALVVTNAVPGRRLLFAFAAVVIGAAAVASLSRGGMISVGAEMLVMLAASFALKSVRGSGRSAPLVAGMVTLLVAGIIAGALWLDRGRVVSRVTEGQLMSAEPGVETLSTSRGWLWQETFEMFRAHPVAGVGLGAYATAYPAFSRADRRVAVEQAHNDYLQILADAGLIGGALAACFVALVVAEMARALRRARDPLLAATALGGVAGVAGLMVHSAFDFNLQIPANSLLFLLALAVVIQSGRVQYGER
jgi:O-antigen ligase